MNSDKFFLDDDGSQLYYEISGKGEPIIFIHGFSLDHRMWRNQVVEFSKNFQTLRYDMRGFGKSSIPDGNYSHHHDLARLMESLNLQTAHIVGLSLGGEVGIDFALEYPHKVKSLSLFDSSLGGFASTIDWNVHADEVSLSEAKSNWMNHQVFSSIQAKPAVKMDLQTILNDYSGWHWFHKDPRKRLQPSAKDRLGEITCPVLLVVGENDLNYYHDIADLIQKNVAQAEVHTIPNAGHLINMEQPEKVNEMIYQFFSKS